MADVPSLIAARRWIGTPYFVGQAARGLGCDCVGLIRGVWADLTGNPPPPVPGWRPDWFNGPDRPLVEAARTYLHPVPLAEAAPGDMVVLRIQGTREAHCGILDHGDQIIHAVEGAGVVLVPFASFRAGVSFAARFPAP